jgi:hypothetical protein
VLTVIVAADVFDGRLDSSPWTLITGIGMIIWGPQLARWITRRD